MTGVIDSCEPCSKNVKVSVSQVQSTSNSTVSSNKRKSTDLHKSRCPKKSKIDIDSSTDNTALPCPKKDDKLIVSLNLKDIKKTKLM